MVVQTQSKDMYITLMESAKRIGQIAEAEALKAENDATVSENVIQAIRDEGIPKLILPKDHGGPQIDFTTFADIVKEVGYYNLSAAWITYFFALHNAWVAYLPTHRQKEIVESGGLLADIFAPIGQLEKVDGGYLVSGNYNFVSGIKYAGWVGVGALLPKEGTDEKSMGGFVINTKDIQIIENWDSMGLRGSGSHSIIVDKVFVPDDLVIDLGDLAQKREPNFDGFDKDFLYYNASFHPAFFVGFPAMALGAAQRALHEFKKGSQGRVRMSGENEGASPRSQRVLATLTIKYRSATSLMKTYIELLEADEPVHPSEFKAIRAEIIQLCIDIAVKCTLTLGASSLIKGHPVEMITRDLIAIGTHITSLYEDAIDVYGKHLFDYPTNVLG